MKSKIFPKLNLGAMAALLIVFAIFHFSNTIVIPTIVFFVSIGFGLLNFLLYRNIVKSNEKSPQRSISAFMGAIGIKLFVAISVIGIYLYVVREHAIAMAISSFAIYMVYTVVLIKGINTDLNDKPSE